MLFRAYGQGAPKLLQIVNEDCAVRGISEVYFKSFTSKKVISESKRIASLELWAPNTAEITVVKKDSGIKSADREGAAGIETAKRKSQRRDAVNKNSAKSIKLKSKSPAGDSRNTADGKKAAKKTLRGRR